MDFSEDADDENIDPDVSDDQRPFLERLRHLDGEQSNNISIRLNFGLNQSLSTENIKTNVRPPPGFSSFQKQEGIKETKNQTEKFCIGKGFQLPSGSGLSISGQNLTQSMSTPSQGLSLISLTSSASSTSLGSKPSLGMLASTHLTSSNTPLLQSALGSSESKPSLNMLASSHLTSSNDKKSEILPSSETKPSLNLLASSHLSTLGTSGLKPSLGMLATNHLSSADASSGFKLGNLSSLSAKSDSKPSLQSLASTHLNSSSSAQSVLETSGLEVGPTSRSKSPEHPEIDLLSALKLNNSDSKDGDIQVMQVPGDNVKIPDSEESLDVDILVTPLTFSKVKSILRRKTKSPFSVAITRKWTRRVPRLRMKVYCEKYSNAHTFKFDTPSPDDVVLQAQQQSRAFNKLKIA